MCNTCLGQAVSNPDMDKQLMKLVNDFRVNMGVAPIKTENYNQACLNARNNYKTRGRVIVSKVKDSYLRSDGKYVCIYDLGNILKQLPSDFLLSNKFTAIAVYSEGDNHYISVARS